MDELLKLENLELLKIKRALVNAGYYAYRFERKFGTDRIYIEAIPYDPSRHEEAVKEAEEKLKFV